MLIFIRALSGTVIRLNVSPCETILTVKTRILQSKGIPVNQQHLIYDGIELRNETLLAAAQISHGALLRLVLGVQSGPLTRDSAHASCTTQFCHKPSVHKTVCPLAIPVTPFHRPQAPTVLFPVLCAPTRVPEPPAEHRPQQHEQHNRYHGESHPTSHVSDYQSSDSSQQHSTYPVEWEDSQYYVSAEFAVDDDSLGVAEDGMSEIAEYLGYAIDEDELTLQQQQKEHSDIASVQSVAGNRSPSPDPLNRINPVLIPSTHCPFVPFYPIQAQTQWVVNAINPPDLTGGVQPSQAHGTVSVPVTRFSPGPLAFGIPLPLAPTKVSPTYPASVSQAISLPWDASSPQTARRTTPPSVAFALPAHPCTVQLTNFVSDLSCWSGANSSLVPATVSNLLLPPFALVPVGNLNAPTHMELRADKRIDNESDPVDLSLSFDTTSSSSQTSTQAEHSIPTHIPETKENSAESPSGLSLSATSCITSATQTRCFTCQRRTRIAQGFSCRCQRWFCHRHHHPEDHSCLFDFKTMSISSSGPSMTVTSRKAVVSELGSSEAQ